MIARPHVVVRCDGSPAIGMGHVMRQLALAAAMRAEGASVVFAMRPLGSAAFDAVRAGGFDVHALPYDGLDQLARLDARDLDATIAAVRGADAVIVDHYGADDAYLAALASSGARFGVVDELAERRLDAAAWVLNQNLGADRLPYETGAGRVRLLGPHYALVREEFAAARMHVQRRFDTGDARVLITMGGGDTDAVTAAAVRALDIVNDRRLRVDVALSASANATPLTREAGAASRHDVVLHHRPSSMAALMGRADLAVSAGGSTSWELCALALPMVLVVRADNQRPSSLALAEARCAQVFEEAELGGSLAAAVADWLDDPGRRASASSIAGSLVDGQGCARVAAVALAPVTG